MGTPLNACAHTVSLDNAPSYCCCIHVHENQTKERTKFASSANHASRTTSCPLLYLGSAQQVWETVVPSHITVSSFFAFRRVSLRQAGLASNPCSDSLALQVHMPSCAKSAPVYTKCFSASVSIPHPPNPASTWLYPHSLALALYVWLLMHIFPLSLSRRSALPRIWCSVPIYLLFPFSVHLLLFPALITYKHTHSLTKSLTHKHTCIYLSPSFSTHKNRSRRLSLHMFHFPLAPCISLSLCIFYSF